MNKKNYVADSSTASYTWNDTSAVKTLVIELCLKDGQTLNLSDGYFIKLPFKVKTVPLEGRNIISTKLGATSLNLQIGYDGYMWDTSGVSNSITENLWINCNIWVIMYRNLFRRTGKGIG